MDQYATTKLAGGQRIQAGVPAKPIENARRANGLLLQGVVVATHVSDSNSHPMSDYASDSTRRPRAVYCDVLTQTNIPGHRWQRINNALVLQPFGGMYKGQIWKPKASTMNLNGQPLDQTVVPGKLDGDCVLVGFLNDQLDQPIIIGSLPHPNVDEGHINEDYDLGKRMILTESDGSPNIAKHNGVSYGVDKAGNYKVDSTWGNDGSIDNEGKEPDPPDSAANGNQIHNLPSESSHTVVLWDMTDPDNPSEVMRVTINKTKLEVKVSEGATLTVEDKDGNAKLTLGDGAASVANADLLETWLTNHYHNDPVSGITSTPAVAGYLWNPSINSNKMKIPANV